MTNLKNSRPTTAFKRSKRALAMLELLIGVVILSFGIIPIYYVFTTSKTTVFKSEMSYVALNAARERLDELRLLPPETLLMMAQQQETNWVQMKGSAFHLLVQGSKDREDRAKYKNETLPDPQAELIVDKYDYPKYYERIQFKMQVKHLVPMAQGSGGNNAPSGPPFLFRASVHVRWQEKGEELDEQSDENSKKYRAKRFVSKMESVFSVGGFGEGWKR